MSQKSCAQLRLNGIRFAQKQENGWGCGRKIFIVSRQLEARRINSGSGYGCAIAGCSRMRFRFGLSIADRDQRHPTVPATTNVAAQQDDAMGHVWTAPAVQEESDVSAKRSGAAMYPAYFRLEDYLCRDAAAVAAGPDVIR